MKKTKIQMVEISRLQLNRGQLKWLPRNPRQWTQADIDKMARSLERDPDFVEERPVLATPGKGDALVVFAHNLLTESAGHAGRAALPAVIYTPENEDDRETIRRRALLDNGAMGRNDTDILANEWPYTAEELVDFGYADYTGESKQPAVQAQEDDFDETADAVETRCKTGDIWELGAHRLMCGDSTDATQVALLMNGEKAVLTLTDPPYRLATEGGGILKTANSMKQIHENKVDSFEPLKLNIYSPTNIYTHNKPLIKDYILLAERENLPYDLAIYKKQGLPNYKGHLMTDIEYIAIIGNQDPKKGYDLEMYSKVFSGGKDRENELSYSKPIKLCEKFICLYSDAGDSVLDLFGGSGSTLIAAEQLNRKCYMMELDPHYCDIILARWEKLTGQTARKLE